jgi:hypothetical protein
MTRMTPGEAFVETLAAHGIKTVFGILELGEPFRRDALKKPERFLGRYKPYAVA